MEMKVQITSEVTIKPLSPTPDYLRVHKLSLLDQLAPNTYIPLILFFNSTNQNSISFTSNHLKKSLAATLNHFRPLAGRAKDRHLVDCNDDGATFKEAYVEKDIHTVQREAKVEQLEQLLPCSPYDDFNKLIIRELLAIQINYFACGGIAISVCIHHLIADASSLTTFSESWAAITRGAYDINAGPRYRFDCASVFPPSDSLNLYFDTPEEARNMKHRIVRKRIIFDGSILAALRKKVAHVPQLENPTRYELVAALIWGASMAATRERDGVKDYALGSLVDLRKKVNSPCLEQYIGNIWKWTMVHCSAENIPDYAGLVPKIQKSVRINTSEENWLETNGYLAFLKSAIEQFQNNSKARLFNMSWCKFPYYEIDFGWGKPIWAGCGKTPDTGAYFLDTSDGKGLEAWLGLPDTEMAFFERHLDNVIKHLSPSMPMSRM
ncbi:hypothetical protein K2173_020222 [Erythroxylum novogranatense]|uniref:Uncharacterized protein n=1 Tax=Erythroxylum novogranatense TaxID=1862640 RepID=A0AAV8UBS3_9ROSI|nr:hypothetical protein K2173_020222 [Erythroxylum novogranatense]